MLPESPVVAGKIQHIPQKDVALALEHHTAARKSRVEKVADWGRTTGKASMTENKIARGLAEFVLKWAPAKAIEKRVEWVYGSQVLVNKPAQV